MRRSLLLRSIILTLAVVIGASGRARAQEADYAPFVGDYVGQVVVVNPAGLEKRDLEVIVRRETDGFSVEWTTASARPDGKTKTDRYFIAFKPSPRPGFYAPTDKIDRMGQVVKVDPLGGDPQLLMAKIDGKSMTVYASQLLEDGVFEVQTYVRTLVPGGMKLKFSRVRNGEPQKDIEADLVTKDQTINAK